MSNHWNGLSWSRCSTRLNFGPATLPCFHYDLPQGLRCNAKLFVDDTSLFSTIISPAISSSNLNEDLIRITHSTYQWKMSFNPDITKQAQEIIFSRKKNNTSHPSLYFNNIPIQKKISSKTSWSLFRWKAFVFGTYWWKNKESNSRG